MQFDSHGEAASGGDYPPSDIPMRHYDETGGLHAGVVAQGPDTEEKRLWQEYAHLELLNRHVFDNPDDIIFHTEALAAGIGAAADTVGVVTAPSAAALDREGVLDVLSIPDQLAYLLHDRMAAMAERPTGRGLEMNEIAGYGVCEVEHAALADRGRRAVNELVRAMHGTRRKEDYGYSLNSIHDGVYAQEDGTLQPVVCEVRARLNKQSVLYDAHGHPAITVHTYTRPDSGKRPGVITGTPGEYLTECVRVSDMQMGTFAEVAERLVREVRATARESALEPWVAPFAELQPPSKSIQETAGRMLALPMGLLGALHCPGDDLDHIRQALHFMYGSDVPQKWRALAIAPPEDLLAYAEEYGVTERLLWLMRQAQPIEEAITVAERTALDAQFRVKFEEWRAVAEQKVEAASELARRLKTFRSRTKPKVPMSELPFEAGNWTELRGNPRPFSTEW